MTPRSRAARSRAKRVLDICGAVAGLVAFGPVMCVAASAIRLTLGSPVLFTQVRPGYRGETFTIYKFRTMRPADEGAKWFRTDAERLTPLGSFLRRSSIDELPELFNVLKGDMSLVGPRPLLVEYLEKYTSEEMRRHEVYPGITGWAQVNGRQHIPFSKRLELDVWYVDNWSLWFDIQILLQTVRQALSGAGVESGQNVDLVDDLGLSSDRVRVQRF